MNGKNMSDVIELYLKQLLLSNDFIEIKRSDIAHKFGCVPSQINYVIKTRFTIPKGYKVESKRGGGGYIKIYKINILNHYNNCQNMIELVGGSLTESESVYILNELHSNQMITSKEKNLLESVFKLTGLVQSPEEKQLRARMMIDVLERLAYEE